MMYYIVIETEDGLMVAEVPENKSAEVVASAARGVIIDPGPYHSHEDAYDAMLAVPDDQRARAFLRD
ncbi:MAG: hypothetical protein HKN47_03215 [Pirellulaceae bacterium]|nr:hypothetical protein [Pirellulaceae bacterium]